MNVEPKSYWNNNYSNAALKFPTYDGWLDKYSDMLQKAVNIIDLGCGNGVDTFYLSTLNIKTIACDISEKALEKLVQLVPDAKTKCIDMTKGLPFPNNHSDLIIADLSLHYFDTETTRSIVSELYRVLTSSGSLLCRLNSTKEFVYNENIKEIDKDFYFVNGCTKRFFDEKSIRNFFSDWKISYLKEDKTEKYHFIKTLWEIHACK